VLVKLSPAGRLAAATAGPPARPGAMLLLRLLAVVARSGNDARAPIRMEIKRGRLSRGGGGGGGGGSMKAADNPSPFAELAAARPVGLSRDRRRSAMLRYFLRSLHRHAGVRRTGRF